MILRAPSLTVLVAALLVAACGKVSAEGADAGTADASGDGSASGFCAEQASAVFCADFDTGSLVDQGWTLTTTAGASLNLVASPRSAPFAMEARVPTSDGGERNDALVTRTIPVPGTFQTLRVAFDVQFAQRDDASLPKGAFELSAPSYLVSLSSNGASENYVIVDDGNALQQAFESSTLGRWYRYEFVIGREAANLVLSVTRDGEPLAASAEIDDPVAAPSSTATWNLVLGAMNLSVNGPCTFLFDDVLVTAEAS